MYPITFTNAHATRRLTVGTDHTSGLEWLLGTNYAPLDVRMDLALPVVPAKGGRVLFHLVVGPPHYLAKEVGEKTLNVCRQEHILVETDLLFLFVRRPRSAWGLKIES